jgi:hypothetical protein
MWWRNAKLSVLSALSGNYIPGGVVRKTSEGIIAPSMEKTDNERAMEIRKTNPNEMSTEDKLRSTVNRDGNMHTPPKVNTDQSGEASLEMSGEQTVPASFRPDQRPTSPNDGWDAQPPMGPVSKSTYPTVPPR